MMGLGTNRLASMVAVAAGCAVASASPLGEEPISDVGVLELTPTASLGTVLERYDLTLLDAVPSRHLYLVGLPESLTEQQFELLFLTDTDVDHSELNYESGDPDPGTQSIFLARNQNDFSTQLVRVTLGLPSAHLASVGEGVVVAVVDSGVDPAHPTLVGAIAPGGVSLIGNPADFTDVGNGIDDDGDGVTDELVGHGTFIASIIRMTAPGSQILPIRILDDEGLTTTFLVAKAVYHAIDNGADVINLSLSSRADVFDRAIDRAIREAEDLGIIVVASAGNNASTVPEFPAAGNRVAGVAASDFQGVLAPFTNRGDDVFITAPGIELVGALPGGGYGEASGTSYAAPLVAGTAALVIERGTVRRWDDFRAMARKTARDIEPQNPNAEDDFGFGLLDIQAAVAWEGSCFADIVEDDLLNAADVNAYVTAFLARDPIADGAEPRGVWNTSDINQFVQDFLAGCPDD